ncbi:putative disease resistance RPP13-like protein 1 [Bienertia sinuspersici]
MAIGETILGAVLEVVFDRLASQQVLNFFKSSKLDLSLVDKLKHLMLVAEKLLADAEQKQTIDTKVKLWLDDLKHLFYRAEEIVNEITTEAFRSSVDLSPESESFVTKVRNLIPAFSSSSSHVNSISSEIGDVVAHLDHMVSISAALNLREGSGNTASRRVSTTYLLDDSGVVGRDQEKEELLEFLLSEDAERNKINVVAIVGMGGMGKTTLAKLIYNDESLRAFDLKAWVYVSDQFDLSRLTKSILESITCQPYSGSLDLNYLQHELSEKLKNKRFFLVLDDVWNENYEEWESLRAPLTVGAHGSKIIVTTRNGEVASIMRTAPLIRLKPLSDEDGWLLFSKHAFEVGNPNSNPRIELLGKKIIDKCHGCLWRSRH